VLFRYFRELTGPRLVLWFYAIWYAVVAVRYFDPSPVLWLTSLGLSAVIGFALLLSTRASIGPAKMDRWGIFRLFLMPFCVSSFAALVKGHGFILIFSPHSSDTLLALALCGALATFVLIVKKPPFGLDQVGR
jgi:hypothetical protein